jgi:outer membrane protein assembly factor BamB
MNPVSSKSESTRLRLWPALVLLALLWGLKNLPSLYAEPPLSVFMIAFFGPAICALLIVIWWLAGSRASRREKLVGVVGLVLIFFLTVLLLHPTMRGFPIVNALLPWGITAFVLGLIASRWSTKLPRTAMALLAATVAFGFWTLVRMDGVWGDFEAERAWRWEQTAEERYLADRASTPRSTAVVDRVSEAEWPGFRGPERNAVVPGLALAEDWSVRPPRELWRISVGPGWSSFAVAGRSLFTQEQRGESEVVVAYDADTGAELWVHEYRSRFFEAMGGVGPRATPTLSGGMLFALGAEGVLHRLDPSTGEVVWQADLRQDAEREPPTWGFSSSPLVVDGVVIVHAGGEADRGVLAYGIDDGQLRWGAPSGGHSYSSPQLTNVAGRRSVVQVSDAGVALLDPTDGSLSWQHDWPHQSYRVLQPLVVGESTLLMTTDFSGTRRLDLRREGEGLVAEERWTSRAMKSGFNDYVAHEGFLYGFDPNILACVDLETGERQWKGGRYGNGQLLLLPDADQLLVMAEKGDVVLLRTNPERLEELTRFKVLDGKTWNHPVLVDDRLYVRNAEEAVAFAMPLG